MEYIIRKANEADLPHIVRMLADDRLGARREKYANPLPQVYHAAFQVISSDPNHELVVLTKQEEILGTLQLSLLPYLTYQGGWRAQIEAVRIRSDKRGLGLGAYLIDWAIARAGERRAHVVQLTTDKKRPEALRFYEARGFKATHEGLKLHL